MTKEELQNYGHNKSTTTPETTKQEDFRQPHAHARFTHVHSRTRQFGECHHTHNNSHSTTQSRLTWPFVPSQHSKPNTQSFVFTWFYIMTKEELQNYGHNKSTTTPETTKQEDFRQPHAHARFTHVHSRTRQFGECHHTHNNSHSTTTPFPWMFALTLSCMVQFATSTIHINVMTSVCYSNTRTQ